MHPLPRATGYREHVLNRTVVLPEHRLLFLPVPKTGCTSVLWLLAALAGIPRERFTGSTSAEAAADLTVHDMTAWGPQHQLGRLPADEQHRALYDDGWLRLAVVRDPARRLWSAWATKLLLREPRFVQSYADRPWFPRVPTKPSELVEDFRVFVAALPSGRPLDVHWSVQHELTQALPLNHIGRTEQLDETLAAIRRHVGGDVDIDGLARDNRALLPMPGDALDADLAAVVNDVYAEDYAAFAYPPAAGGDADGEWAERVEQLLPAVQAVVARHERIGVLQRKVRDLERESYAATAHDRGLAGKAAVVNREGAPEFDIHWRWAESQPLDPGFTAVLRVKNEAGVLPWVLPPLFRAVRAVLVVDNESTDGTADVARRVAADVGAADRLSVVSYPFAVSRCGPEHLATPPDSVHSLTYFYNWAFSRVATSYALKWDGDMVLSETGVNALRDLAWQVETGEYVVTMPRYPLYVVDDTVAYLDAWVRNHEYWAWPNRRGYEHAKAFEWELSMWPLPGHTVSLPDWSCVEVKHLDVDEFAHWSQADFAASGRTSRKLRETQVFEALAGGSRLPDGLVRVQAPAGRHVIDYVRGDWLPREKPRLTELHRRLRPELARRYP